MLLDTARGIRDSIVGLNKTVKNLRTEADRNKKQGNEVVTAVNTLLGDLNLDTVEALGEHITELNAQIISKSKINPEKIREEVENGYKKQLTDKDTEVQQLRSVMKETVMGRDVAEAIAKHQGNADLLGPYVRSRLAMVEEGGKMHVRVTDSDGDYVGDGKGGWQTVGAFVESLKSNESFQGAFAARGGPGGSGTPPGGQGQRPGQQQQRPGQQQGDLTPAQKIANGLRQRGFGQHQRVAGASTPPGME
jgi:hypothetical protein